MLCSNCNAALEPDSAYCSSCGAHLLGAAPLPAANSLGEDRALRMLLPVGRSAWAIAAGYAGLFAFLLLFAPLALVFGIIAVRDLRKHPHKRGMGRAVFGIITGTVFTIVLIVVGIAMLTSE